MIFMAVVVLTKILFFLPSEGINCNEVTCLLIRLDQHFVILECYLVFWYIQVEFSTADVEIKLEGNGPWNLGHDIELVYTPGHSEVSAYVCHSFIQVFSHVYSSLIGVG